MAKQYIPGVSGLLTEPNPVDSPSNSLSEAENVIVEQNNKVQARHGFNITDKEVETDFRDNITAVRTDYGARDSIPEDDLNYSGFNYTKVIEMDMPVGGSDKFRYYKNDGNSITLETLKSFQGTIDEGSNVITYVTPNPITAGIQIGDIVSNNAYAEGDFIFPEMTTVVSFTSNSITISSLPDFSNINGSVYTMSDFKVGKYSLTETLSLVTDTPFYDDNPTTKNIPENTVASTHYVTNIQDNKYISYDPSSYNGTNKYHYFKQYCKIFNDNNLPFPPETPLTYSRFVRRNGGACIFKINITYNYQSCFVKFNFNSNTAEIYGSGSSLSIIDTNIKNYDNNYYKVSVTFKISNFNVYNKIEIYEHVRNSPYSDQFFNPKTPLQYDPFIPDINAYYDTKYYEGIQFIGSDPLNNNRTRLMLEYRNINSIYGPSSESIWDKIEIGDKIKFRNDIVGSQQLNIPSSLQYNTYYTIVDKQIGPFPVIRILPDGSSYTYNEYNTPYIVIDHPGVTTTQVLATFNSYYYPKPVISSWRALAISPADFDLSYCSLYQNPNLFYGDNEVVNYHGNIFNNSSLYNTVFFPESNELTNKYGIFTKTDTDWILGYPTKIPISDILLENGTSKIPKFSKIKLVQRFPIDSTNPLPTNLNYDDEFKYLRTETISGITYIVLDISTSYPTAVKTRCRLEITAIPLHLSRSVEYTNTDSVARTTNIGNIIPQYVYTSQYTNSNQFLKFVEYQNSSDEFNTILIAKQTINKYAANQTGLFDTNSSDILNRYYLIDDTGKLGNYKKLPYSDIKNVFNTKESLYFQTENGLSEMNVDDIVSTSNDNKLFDIKWPAFPEITFDFTTSDVYANWLKPGTYFAVRLTFYRELGYSDKESEIYESEPSVPYYIYADSKGTVPKIYLDFKYIYENQEQYRVLNEFTKANSGRKFGIKIYRTKAVPIEESLSTDYYLAYNPIQFDNFMASVISENLVYGAGTGSVDYTRISLRDSYDTYADPNQDTLTYITNSKQLDLEMNIGDYVSIAYVEQPVIINGYNLEFPVINKVHALDSIISYTSSGFEQTYIDPYQYSIRNNPTLSNRELLSSDYKVARLQVIGKTASNGIHYYQFKTVTAIKNATTVYPKDTIIDIRNIIIDRDPVNSYKNIGLILRSFICELTLNDTGLIVFPLLYVSPNEEGETNRNILLPKSESSIKYKDFRVYYGLQTPLTARLFVISQPLVEQIKFYNSFPYYNNPITPALNEFYLPDQNITLPGVNEYTVFEFYAGYNKDEDKFYEPGIMTGCTNEGGKLFLDSSIFQSKSINGNIKHVTRDVEIIAFNYKDNPSTLQTTVLNPFTSYDDVYTTFFTLPTGGALDVNAKANSLKVYIDSNTTVTPVTVKIPTPISGDSTIDWTNSTTRTNASQTYYFSGTVYEQGKLTLRLTSVSGEVNTVSILTKPFYNRQGYYRKYNTSGYEDQDYVNFDLSLDEANDIQLVNFKKLMQRQYSKVLRPEVIDVNSTSYGRNNLSTSMGYGVFNVSGNLNGQYNTDGQVKGFANIDSNGSGFYLDKTNGKIVIRADGTKGDTTNKLNINKFGAPGHILIQHRKTNDSTAKNANSMVICVYSYQSIATPSFGIYEFNGIKPVVGNLSFLETNTSLWSNILIDLFFLDVSNADAIELFPYGLPPINREIIINIRQKNSTYITSIDEYVSTPQLNQTDPTLDQDQNSPIEPFFTLHPHINKPTESIANISSDSSNHRFRQYRKDDYELLDEYTYYIINEFNKQLNLNNIKATLRKGDLTGELYIEYPDGQKIEMQNEYGSHVFNPIINKPDIKKTISNGFNGAASINVIKTNNFTKLAERTNNEYLEKNLIKWSRRNIPEITTPKLYMYLGKNNKNIIGCAANSDDLFIFKEDGIFRITDYGDLDSSISLPDLRQATVSTTVICQSANSIQEINDEIIFLSQYGFTSLSGGSMENISSSIDRDILNLIALSPSLRIRSFVNEERNIYCCTLINESTQNLDVKSGTYIFNVKTRQWTFMDEEILAGLEDHQGRTIAAYRQRPVIAKLADRVQTDDGIKPVFNFTESYSDNKLQRASESEPTDLFYITREQFTNGVRQNPVDQYDFKFQKRYEGSNVSKWIKKDNATEFCIRTETIRPNTIFRDKFSTSVEHALVTSVSDNPALNSTVSVIDSFVTLFANRMVYLKRNNGTEELYEIQLTRTGFDNRDMLVYFKFLSDPPSWFTAMSNGYFNTGLTATYEIMVGVPVKITFNPESGSQPDSNKHFQEYMVHTGNVNKGLIMKFKTDGQLIFTKDRRFVYDNAATTRNVFRTYIPTNVSRGRYLIRQVKHDVPLENLIITGQTIVMRDTGSSRVQKDKDNE